jgi:hypothetical protein
MCYWLTRKNINDASETPPLPSYLRNSISSSKLFDDQNRSKMSPPIVKNFSIKLPQPNKIEEVQISAKSNVASLKTNHIKVLDSLDTYINQLKDARESNKSHVIPSTSHTEELQRIHHHSRETSINKTEQMIYKIHSQVMAINSSTNHTDNTSLISSTGVIIDDTYRSNRIKRYFQSARNISTIKRPEMIYKPRETIGNWEQILLKNKSTFAVKKKPKIDKVIKITKPMKPKVKPKPQVIPKPIQISVPSSNITLSSASYKPLNIPIDLSIQLQGLPIQGTNFPNPDTNIFLAYVLKSIQQAADIILYSGKTVHKIFDQYKGSFKSQHELERKTLKSRTWSEMLQVANISISTTNSFHLHNTLTVGIIQ